MQRYSQETKERIHEYHLYGHSNRSIAKLLGISKSGVSRYILSLQAAEKQRLRELIKPEATHAAHRLDGPKILFFDLETAAALAYVFGRRKVFVSQDAIHTEGGWILTAGYRWMNGPKTEVIYNYEEILAGNDYTVCKMMYDLFLEADAVVGHNLLEFDWKMLETRLLANGLPPLPYVQKIDTLLMARKKYRFPSNALDSLADFLGIGRKVAHSGISMWKKIQEGDLQELENMVRYNEGDVDLLMDVYFALCQRGLVSSFNAALYYDDDEMRCRVCGSTDLHFTGRKVPVGLNVYEEVTCNSCLAVQRTRQSSIGKTKRDNLLMSV